MFLTLLLWRSSLSHRDTEISCSKAEEGGNRHSSIHPHTHSHPHTIHTHLIPLTPHPSTSHPSHTPPHSHPPSHPHSTPIHLTSLTNPTPLPPTLTSSLHTHPPHTTHIPHPTPTHPQVAATDGDIKIHPLCKQQPLNPCTAARHLQSGELLPHFSAGAHPEASVVLQQGALGGEVGEHAPQRSACFEREVFERAVPQLQPLPQEGGAEGAPVRRARDWARRRLHRGAHAKS